MPVRYQDRSDSVNDKLRLLQSVLAAGNHDVALSLAESIKDTIQFEQQLNGRVLPPQIKADEFTPVNELPAAWSAWASGWSFCKTIAAFETVGIARRREPVDISVGFLTLQTTDLQREVRVARLDREQGTLHEIPSQLYHEIRRGEERHCRLVFLADVPMQPTELSQ